MTIILPIQPYWQLPLRPKSAPTPTIVEQNAPWLIYDDQTTANESEIPVRCCTFLTTLYGPAHVSSGFGWQRKWMFWFLSSLGGSGNRTAFTSLFLSCTLFRLNPGSSSVWKWFENRDEPNGDAITSATIGVDDCDDGNRCGEIAHRWYARVLHNNWFSDFFPLSIWSNWILFEDYLRDCCVEFPTSHYELVMNKMAWFTT